MPSTVVDNKDRQQMQIALDSNFKKPAFKSTLNKDYDFLEGVLEPAVLNFYVRILFFQIETFILSFKKEMSFDDFRLEVVTERKKELFYSINTTENSLLKLEALILFSYQDGSIDVNFAFFSLNILRDISEYVDLFLENFLYYCEKTFGEIKSEIIINNHNIPKKHQKSQKFIF